jgi:hypothetical protein
MTKKQIAILVGLGLLVLLIFCALGYFVLSYFGTSTPKPIAVPEPTATLMPTEPVGGEPEERARIARHVALYDGGHGSLDEVCLMLSRMAYGEQTLAPQSSDADFYKPSKINQYWTAELNDPNGDVWTVTCVVNLSRVTSEGIVSISEPALVFLYNTEDGYIYLQGTDEGLVVFMDQFFNVEDGWGQPKIYAPLD